MVVLAEPVLPDLKNERIQFPFDPADNAILLRIIRSLVLIIRMREYPLRFLEADTALRILS